MRFSFGAVIIGIFLSVSCVFAQEEATDASARESAITEAYRLRRRFTLPHLQSGYQRRSNSVRELYEENTQRFLPRTTPTWIFQTDTKIQRDILPMSKVNPTNSYRFVGTNIRLRKNRPISQPRNELQERPEYILPEREETELSIYNSTLSRQKVTAPQEGIYRNTNLLHRISYPRKKTLKIHPQSQN